MFARWLATVDRMRPGLTKGLLIALPVSLVLWAVIILGLVLMFR